uniref:Piwi domain-containing protein n=1 Tax=Panagrolaimus sp. ES5 TaxID=591445 RepID=A0AC34G8P1_9BILA
MDEYFNKILPYKNQRALVFLVDSSKESHPLLKLAGNMASIPTQHLMLETAESDHKSQTLENIVLQCNAKSGGLNYAVDFMDSKLDLNRGNILLIGLDVTHPTGEHRRGATLEPSFVGITGNYLPHPCAIAGKFFAQESRQESVDSEQLVDSVLEMLEKASKFRRIDTVVLKRDGCSEGQYNMVLTQELQAIEKACADFFKHKRTSIIGIIVTKSSNVRHFDVSNNVRPQNLPYGSVITFGTRALYDEFFICPHHAYQGTSKAILVTIVRNDLKIGINDIEKFLYALATLHQVSCSIVSLPESIMQADKLAFKGQLIYRAYLSNYLHGDQNNLDYKAHTKMISFDEGKLPNFRYTA